MNKAAAGVVSRVAGLIKYKCMSADCGELPSPLFKENMHAHCVMQRIKIQKEYPFLFLS